jgi:hypothetical protein
MMKKEICENCYEERPTQSVMLMSEYDNPYEMALCRECRAVKNSMIQFYKRYEASFTEEASIFD